MYQTHNGFTMYVVDRNKFKNAWEAIFYELPLMKNNKSTVGIVGLLIVLIMLIASSFHPEKLGKLIGISVCGAAILFPFVSAFFKYHSIFKVKDGKFCITAFGFTYCRGSLGDIIEIRRLTNWSGCYRVRTKGYSDISGFLIFSDEIPSVLKNVKIADGVYFNMGNDRKLSQN